MFNFLRNWQTAFCVVMSCLCSHQPSGRCSTSSLLVALSDVYFNISHSSEQTMISICICLMSNDVEHLFMYLLAQCFAHFIELYKYCLYISYIIFCQIYTYEKNALPSHFLTVIQRAVVFNFDKVLFINFFMLVLYM